jgi:group I intron endonuclease
MEVLTNTSRQGIYGILYGNRIIYVGQSKNMYRRSKQHDNKLKNKKHHNFILQRIYNKNRIEFKYVVIEKVEDSEKLTKKEQFWIDFYKTFNLSKANGSHKHKKEALLKMSEYAKNRTEEHKINLKKALKGKVNKNKGKKGLFKHTDESKRKIGDASKGNKYNLGKKLSEEVKKKLSTQRKNIINTKIVLNTDLGIFYDSLKLACEALNLNYKTTSDRLRGRIKNNTTLIYI